MPDFEIVFGCTGNRARSPTAAAVIRESTRGLPLGVNSFGTLDLGDLPAIPEAVAAAGELGLDLTVHRARTLEGTNLEGADLVVGFERMHVMTAVVSAQANLERTFTLPELVDLLGAPCQYPTDVEPIERARIAIAAAHSRRPKDLALVGLPELADPLGQPQAEFERTARQVRNLTLRVAHVLFGPSVNGTGR